MFCNHAELRITSCHAVHKMLMQNQQIHLFFCTNRPPLSKCKQSRILDLKRQVAQPKSEVTLSKHSIAAEDKRHKHNDACNLQTFKYDKTFLKADLRMIKSKCLKTSHIIPFVLPFIRLWRLSYFV